MTEYPVFRETSAEGLFERVDVIYSLADERTLAEHILINVGNGARIGINTRLAAEKSCISRLICLRKAHRYARLQNAVAFDHAPPGLIIGGAIERMRHGPGKLPCGIPRQLCIGIERDHVFHMREKRGVADDA